jgi:hypothetical protein
MNFPAESQAIQVDRADAVWGVVNASPDKARLSWTVSFCRNFAAGESGPP